MAPRSPNDAVNAVLSLLPAQIARVIAPMLVTAGWSVPDEAP
jgi:hypothetical protein